MAITYGFFNSVGGDRKYSAEDIGRYLHGLVSSGVYADASDALQVLANGDLTVTVRPGRAMLDHHYMESDEPLILTLASGGTLPRIDAIVAQLSVENRSCTIAVKRGTQAATPAAPAMERTDFTKEWALAYVYVEKLTSNITQNSITDTRANNEVCGWVHGLINQVDTSTLFAQYEAAYDAAVAQMAADREANQQTFAEWLAGLAISGSMGVPIPTPANAGTAPVVKPDGSGYELAAVASAAAVAAAASAAAAAQMAAGTAQTTANEAKTAAATAQSTADAAKTAAGTAQTTANAAMPKAGGTFTGKVAAQSLSAADTRLRNCYVENNAGTMVSSMQIWYKRK